MDPPGIIYYQVLDGLGGVGKLPGQLLVLLLQPLYPPLIGSPDEGEKGEFITNMKKSSA